MTVAQYRCLVAHMIYWKRGLVEAMRDCSVIGARQDVIDELSKAGYQYDAKQDTLRYTLDDDD